MKQEKKHEQCDAFDLSDGILVLYRGPLESQCTEDVIYGCLSLAGVASLYTPSLSLQSARSRHWYGRHSLNLCATQSRIYTFFFDDSKKIHKYLNMHKICLGGDWFEFSKRIRCWHVVGKGLEPARDLDAISDPHGLYGDSLKRTISVWGDIDIVTRVHYVAKVTRD